MKISVIIAAFNSMCFIDNTVKLHNILRYGLMKRFKRGVRISIALTFKCNLKCPYCVVEMPTGKLPVAKESTLDELKHFITSFPYKLREIKLTGGSPELHPGFVEFANWLLDEGYFVTIFTNLLHYSKLSQLKRTYRLMFISTYHHSADPKKYLLNYIDLCRIYRIRVEEIADAPYSDLWHEDLKLVMKTGVKLLPYSHLKNLIGEKEMRENKVMLRVSPDLQIFSTCYNVYVNENKML